MPPCMKRIRISSRSRHARTVYGTACAFTGHKFDPISQDACAFLDNHAIIDGEAGQVAVEEEAGCTVAGWFKDVRAAIHDCEPLCIDEAAFWFIALKRRARINCSRKPPASSRRW